MLFLCVGTQQPLDWGIALCYHPRPSQLTEGVTVRSEGKRSLQWIKQMVRVDKEEAS